MAQETRHAGGKEDRKISKFRKIAKSGQGGVTQTGENWIFNKKNTLHNRSSSHSLSSRLVSGQKIRTGESLKTQNLENWIF